MDTEQIEKPQPKKRNKIIFAVVGVVLLGIIGFFSWNKYQESQYELGDSNIGTETGTLYPDTEDYDYYNKMLFDISEYDGISQKYREGIMKVF